MTTVYTRGARRATLHAPKEPPTLRHLACALSWWRRSGRTITMLVRCSSPFGRQLLMLVLATALAVRALVPVGWMPGTTMTGAMVLVPCPGAASPAVAMPGMHHGEAGDPAHPAADHPCAFAGLALAGTAAHPPLVLPPPRVAVERTVAPGDVVAIGRGLAAPPPPATGPPLFA